MKSLTLFVCIIYTSIVFKPVLTLANYYVNKDILIDLFCINVKKPELSCEAKCQLNSQIEESLSTGDSESIPAIRTEISPITAILTDKINHENHFQPGHKLQTYNKENFYHLLFVKKPFKPPRQIS